jgi:hypothetical protein
MLTSYGLFWHKDNVIWSGAKGKKSRLLGKPLSPKHAHWVDVGNQAGIYLLYQDYELVYVGQTGRNGAGAPLGATSRGLLHRLRAHTRSTAIGERWNRFSWFGLRAINAKATKAADMGIDPYTGNTFDLRQTLGGLVLAFHPPAKTVIDSLEALLIFTAEPKFNGQDGRFKSVQRLYQVRDPRLP